MPRAQERPLAVTHVSTFQVSATPRARQTPAEWPYTYSETPKGLAVLCEEEE